MKYIQLFCIVLVACFVSAKEEGRGTLFAKDDHSVVLANINSQLAALQTQVTANANALSASNGQISNLNTQIAAAITAANAAATATAATQTRINTLISTLVQQENAILAAMTAAALPAPVLAAQTSLIAAITALNAPIAG
ncbi:unnamed protein product [Chironomus riparius]|uniref:Uncharacterized protein n=1 Tax=Chironomus riparius TaxID=315576 RepID=A0A9N9RZ88_9DIPT|nr:unnamed protein product [Chironomus riparius]